MRIQNYYVGENEFILVSQSGVYNVIEEFENWKTVFTGTVQECQAYIDNRYIEYMAENVF